MLRVSLWLRVFVVSFFCRANHEDSKKRQEPRTDVIPSFSSIEARLCIGQIFRAGFFFSGPALESVQSGSHPAGPRSWPRRSMLIVPPSPRRKASSRSSPRKRPAKSKPSQAGGIRRVPGPILCRRSRSSHQAYFWSERRASWAGMLSLLRWRLSLNRIGAEEHASTALGRFVRRCIHGRDGPRAEQSGIPVRAR
jgi:hypothetical protein